jgi:hypothetical protein
VTGRTGHMGNTFRLWAGHHPTVKDVETAAARDHEGSAVSDDGRDDGRSAGGSCWWSAQGVFAGHAMRAGSAHPECRPRAGSLIEAPRVA